MVEQSGGTAHPAYRVFISYAQQPDDPGHAESVERFWIFLRRNGIDARLDRTSMAQRLDWTLWMADEIRAADFVLVIASDAYRERAEGRSGPDDGRGVQWEARLIRDAFYQRQDATARFVPVVLPGESVDGVPDFLAPYISTVYYVSDFTVAGAEPLLRFLTGQPEVEEPELGPVPVLSPRTLGRAPSAPRPAPAPRRRADSFVHNEISGVLGGGMVIQTGSLDQVTFTGQSTPSGHEVGGGVRGWKASFQQRYDELRRQVDPGAPTTDVEQCGPGVCQEFSGGWVLCGRPDRRVVAVPEPVWDALHAAGGAATGTDPLSTLGFPSTSITDDDATRVELTGGRWGPGRLERPDTATEWEWRPDPRNFSREMTRNATMWTGDHPIPRLRVRAIASLHNDQPAYWDIAPDRRRHFEAALPASALARVLARITDDVAGGQWHLEPNGNRPDRVGYTRLFVGGDGETALAAGVMAAVRTMGEVVTCAELRLYDRLLPSGRRMALPDVRDFLTAAWRMATVDLLDVLSFPPGPQRWREPPRVELRLTTEAQPDDQNRQPVVADLVDLAAFGPLYDRPHSEMAVTIPAVPYLSDDERSDLTRQALAYLGRTHGYVDATSDRLDPAG